MKCRGIRGATTTNANTKRCIFEATKELLQEMFQANSVDKDEVACIIFTTTKDLNAAFPATGARAMGLADIPLLCSQEIEVPYSLPSCIRILVLFNTNLKADDIKHIYIKGAVDLKSDTINDKAGPKE
jgi:chorismate mutase